MVRKALVLFVLLVASPAAAKIQFLNYDGPANPLEGTGGTKEVYNGVEYWRSGTPPRKYRIVGVIFDDRQERGDAIDDSIRSQRLAKLVKEHGGDAVIVIGAATLQTGGAAVPIGGMAFLINEQKTRFEHRVIKYVE